MGSGEGERGEWAPTLHPLPQGQVSSLFTPCLPPTLFMWGTQGRTFLSWCLPLREGWHGVCRVRTCWPELRGIPAPVVALPGPWWAGAICQHSTGDDFTQACPVSPRNSRLLASKQGPGRTCPGHPSPPGQQEGYTQLGLHPGLQTPAIVHSQAEPALSWACFLQPCLISSGCWSGHGGRISKKL